MSDLMPANNRVASVVAARPVEQAAPAKAGATGEEVKVAPGSPKPEDRDSVLERANLERDPIVYLVQKLQRASFVLGDRDPGLTAGIQRLSEQAARPESAGQELFRTQVAYTVQDIEKVVGKGVISMPPALRAEMTERAATSPGLQNRRMEALIATTPELSDRGLIRDLRRAGGAIASMQTDQDAPNVKEHVEVLENRVRLAARITAVAEASSNPAPHVPEPPNTQFIAGTGGASDDRPTRISNEVTSNPSGSTPARNGNEGTRVSASPGDAVENAPAQHMQRGRTEQSVAGASTGQGGNPKNLISHIVDGMRSQGTNGDLPWNPPPVAMAERVALFQNRLDQSKAEQLAGLSEKSSQAYMQAVETFATGPGAGILAKIDAAASTEPGGTRRVMSEMRDGGRYASLRSEFDGALQSDRAFAAAYNQVERTGQQFGRDRLDLAANFEARKLDANQLDARFQKVDEAIGDATSKIPGRAQGKSAMDELGQQIVEILTKAAERVRASFGRTADSTARASSSPSPSP